MFIKKPFNGNFHTVVFTGSFINQFNISVIRAFIYGGIITCVVVFYW